MVSEAFRSVLLHLTPDLWSQTVILLYFNSDVFSCLVSVRGSCVYDILNVITDFRVQFPLVRCINLKVKQWKI